MRFELPPRKELNLIKASVHPPKSEVAMAARADKRSGEASKPRYFEYRLQMVEQVRVPFERDGFAPDTPAIYVLCFSSVSVRLPGKLKLANHPPAIQDPSCLSKTVRISLSGFL